eukprot:385876-Rhodomonas_salina.2
MAPGGGEKASAVPGHVTSKCTGTQIVGFDFAAGSARGHVTSKKPAQWRRQSVCGERRATYQARAPRVQLETPGPGPSQWPPGHRGSSSSCRRPARSGPA